MLVSTNAQYRACLLAPSEVHSKDWIGRAAVQDTLEADFGQSQLVERHSQAATRLQKVARQHLDSAGWIGPVGPGRDKLGRAAAETAGNTAAAEIAAVETAAETAVERGCMHFGSHIPTRPQN